MINSWKSPTRKLDDDVCCVCVWAFKLDAWAGLWRMLVSESDSAHSGAHTTFPLSSSHSIVTRTL